MIKVQYNSIVKEIPKGSLKWYLAAGWKVVKDDKTNTEEIITTQSEIS